MMKQEERLDWLLAYLCGERQESIGLPKSDTEKRALMQSLMNVRPPIPASDDFIRVQDAFLQEESKRRGIVYAADIPVLDGDKRISLWQGDITRLAVDAIVNAANDQLLGCFAPNHHCIDNAIHSAAGIQLRAACDEIMQRQGHAEITGDAKVTSGYNLPAKHVIHTVGPIIQGSPSAQDAEALARCYSSCMALAASQSIRTIAFCCISTGIYAFPKQLAARIAIKTVMKCLSEQNEIERVIFVVFTQEDNSLYCMGLESWFKRHTCNELLPN